MKTTVMNSVKAFTLFALGLAIAAMGIYVADANGALCRTGVQREEQVRVCHISFNPPEWRGTPERICGFWKRTKGPRLYRPTRIRMPASNARTAISGAGKTSAIMPASP
jgi:hypothetical protein